MVTARVQSRAVRPRSNMPQPHMLVEELAPTKRRPRPDLVCSMKAISFRLDRISEESSGKCGQFHATVLPESVWEVR